MIQIINADAGRLPLQSSFYHSLISSPPFYKLREYGVKTLFPAMAYRPAPGMSMIEMPEWFGELGQEPVPEWFIGHLVQIAREGCRVLRKDGTWWLNMGDTYWCDKKRSHARTVRPLHQGEERGQLMGIPYMLMRALQADGWIVRDDTQWVKRNPIPNGQAIGKQWRVRDDGSMTFRNGSWRTTRAHEVVLMLTKVASGYYSDSQAARMKPKGYSKRGGNAPTKSARNGRINNDGTGNSTLHKMSANGANLRSYIVTKTEAHRGQHEAPFPTALTRPLMLASTPKWVCPQCGGPWAAVVKRVILPNDTVKHQTLGYRPTCSCCDDLLLDDALYDWLPLVAHQAAHLHPIPGIVGDIFTGSGTVPVVAQAEGFRCVACDLSHTYLKEDAMLRLSAPAKVVVKVANGQLAFV